MLQMPEEATKMTKHRGRIGASFARRQFLGWSRGGRVRAETEQPARVEHSQCRFPRRFSLIARYSGLKGLVSEQRDKRDSSPCRLRRSAKNKNLMEAVSSLGSSSPSERRDT